MESFHAFLACIVTMNLSGAVAAEVTRRTEAGAHIIPPRYLGGYDPVHGEPPVFLACIGTMNCPFA